MGRNREENVQSRNGRCEVRETGKSEWRAGDGSDVGGL